ncbi:MAG: hypothetical protein WC621_03520 [Patescibacteria group bacterium]
MKAVDFVVDKFWGVAFGIADRLPNNFIYRYILYVILATTGCGLITYQTNPAKVAENCLILMIVFGVLLLIVYYINAFDDEDWKSCYQKLIPICVATIIYAFVENNFMIELVAIVFLIMSILMGVKKEMIVRTALALFLQTIILLLSYYLIANTKNTINWLVNTLSSAFPSLD